MVKIRCLDGFCPAECSADNSTINTLHAVVDQNTLEKQLRCFWELEEVEAINKLSDDDQACENHFCQTHYRNADGQYVVRLPIKSQSDFARIANTRSHAKLRLQSVEKRLSQNDGLKKQYVEFMNIYKQLGHMKQLVTNIDSQPNYYIPHHHVIKEASSSTKLRVVFDASTKSSSGSSLNDLLHAGPKLQQNLMSIVLRWRMHRFVFVSDIEKMFRQILVNEADHDLQRILWRSDSSKEFIDFRLCTVTYGTACAPYLAIRVLKQLAADEKERYPNASRVLDRDCYVDDILSGADDVSTVLLLQTELIQLLNCGKFTLKKCSANIPQLLDHLPDEYKESSSIEIADDSAIKTLGLYWSPVTDTFGYNVDIKGTSSNSQTKRILLSAICQLFDPIGWLAPVIITGKILFQGLWLTGCNWDEPLDDRTSNAWLSFRNQLHLLNNVKIQRWLSTTKVNVIELHGFCDASCVAYAAAVYIRAIHANGTVHTNLISSKTKVAPISQVSLPRLELCGAHLLTKLLTRVHSDMELVTTSVYAHTDSTIVLAWLNRHSSCWKTFVANRVSKIQSCSLPIQWRHVKSAENPADCASRGITPSELLSHHLWWAGPSWLRDESSPWLSSASSSAIHDTKLEERAVSTSCNTSSTAVTITWAVTEKYSSLQRI